MTIVLFIVVVLDSARTVADGSYTLSLFYALLVIVIVRVALNAVQICLRREQSYGTIMVQVALIKLKLKN